MQRSIHISKHLVMRRMACHWVLFACSQSQAERADRGRASKDARACKASRASESGEQKER